MTRGGGAQTRRQGLERAWPLPVLESSPVSLHYELTLSLTICSASRGANRSGRLPFGQSPGMRFLEPVVVEPVGADNAVTSRDLGIFTNQAAEPVPAQNPNICSRSGRIRAPGWRGLLPRPVRAVGVVVVGVLAEVQAEVPFTSDQHPVQALAADAGDPAFAGGVRTGVLMVRIPAACGVTHSPVGWAVIPARWTRRVPCSMTNSTYTRWSDTVSTWKKSVARIVFA